MKKVFYVLLFGASLCATSSFADQGQAGWACYTQNRTNGHGGRWFDKSQSEAARGGLNACEAGGRYSCVLVKCVPAGSPKDDGCPECTRVH
jgi:hypothetical protein